MTKTVVQANELSEFWRGIYPEGMTVEQVLNELHDLEICADNVPKVYDHVTGGKISKANTLASEVIAVHDDCRNKDIEQALKEDCEDRAAAEPTADPIFECCSDACPWRGPRSETVHPKHDPEHLLCPECHEVVEQV